MTSETLHFRLCMETHHTVLRTQGTIVEGAARPGASSVLELPWKVTNPLAGLFLESKVVTEMLSIVEKRLKLPRTL
jgi:hypothetical protein